MAQHNELGKQGEELARTYLVDNGYQILETNWRYKKIEIDIIAQKESMLICVEVKTRNSSYFGNPEEFVGRKKIKQLQKGINTYIEHKGIDLEIRFDIIAIIKNKSAQSINHIEDAFYFFS